MTAQLMLQKIEALQQAGAMALLRPLLLDNVARYVLDKPGAGILLCWLKFQPPFSKLFQC
jgi:hypothetical protein